MKLKLKLMFSLLLVISSILSISNVNADYSSLNTRVNQNKTMINSSNNLNSIDRERYKDKDLKDLKEVNYKGLATYQQQEINNLAKTILENNTLNDYDKIQKFYNWIVENYYYYNTPNKLENLKKFGNVYDNPYYLLTYEYKHTGKIRARSNGFSSMLVALSRNQGIPARTVGGYYNKQVETNYITWGSDINQNDINHTFVEVFVNNKWIVLDPTADCHNTYNDINNEYIKEEQPNKYFDPAIETLSTTHIMFKHYPGSKSVAYLTNTYEKSKITQFLNKTYNKKTNGKRINYYYNKNKSSTWFTNKTSSYGDGYGKVTSIVWPTNKSLTGTLDLSGFSSLEKLYVPNNKISNLKMINTPSIKTVAVAYNKISNLTVTGSKNLTLLSAYGNPSTYIKYNFGPSKRTAIIKASSGGTVSVRYEKTKKGYMHKLYAKTKTGYTFKGWYQGNKRISTKKSIIKYKGTSFTYTAKFQKKDTKTYILISIKKQKLWYYKKGKLMMSTSVVTGHKGKHDTPKGTYKIRGKARNVYLVGPDYKSYVNYWMLIDRRTQIGLHDASWRSSFGGSIYKWNGSHGCINMPYKKAKYIYNKAPTGTKVIIK